MVGPLDSIELHQLFKTPLLITESAKDFADLSAALTQEIKPRGIVEQIYVADIAALVWEILRLRRCKTVIVNTAFNNAVFDIVKRLSGNPAWGHPRAGMLRPCEGRYRSWLSWIDTNPGLCLGATGRSGRSSKGDQVEIANQHPRRRTDSLEILSWTGALFYLK